MIIVIELKKYGKMYEILLGTVDNCYNLIKILTKLIFNVGQVLLDWFQ